MLEKVLWVVLLLCADWPDDDGPDTVECVPQYQILSGEYKSLKQFGDRIEAEYERLNPDGSISRHVAYGNPKKGLEYQNVEIDPMGNILHIDSPHRGDRLEDTRPSRTNDNVQEWQSPHEPLEYTLQFACLCFHFPFLHGIGHWNHSFRFNSC